MTDDQIQMFRAMFDDYVVTGYEGSLGVALDLVMDFGDMYPAPYHALQAHVERAAFLKLSRVGPIPGPKPLPRSLSGVASYLYDWMESYFPAHTHGGAVANWVDFSIDAARLMEAGTDVTYLYWGYAMFVLDRDLGLSTGYGGRYLISEISFHIGERPGHTNLSFMWAQEGTLWGDQRGGNHSGFVDTKAGILDGTDGALLRRWAPAALPGAYGHRYYWR